jgi:predicted Fe-Mo cluster-binding NifX family protein
MKIAVTATKPQHDAPLDRRFGRCAHFVIFDSGSDSWEAFPNPAIDASGGAGPQAAEFLASKGVGSVVSGDFGPNAYEALAAAGIAMYKVPEGLAFELAAACKQGRLTQVTAPTSAQRHGGGGGRRGR